MDAIERDHINRNLAGLIERTSCNSKFLAFLASREALSMYDLEEIESCRSLPEKARRLYSRLVTRNNGYNALYEALRATNQTGAIEILAQRRGFSKDSDKDYSEKPSSRKRELEKEPKRRRLSESSGVFGVRAPSQLFSGRRRELEVLHEMLHKPAINHARIASIVGLGGVGKTQLARCYIQRNSAHFENIVWINAESEGTLSSSFRKLAEEMEISMKDSLGLKKDTTTVVSEVYNRIKGKSLVVLDNAERASYVNKFLRSGSESYRFLITSRDANWKLEFAADTLSLTELSYEDAVELVRMGLEISDQDEKTVASIQTLVVRLQCFPLALQQAISYIKEQKSVDDYSILTYLDELEQNKEELLDSNSFQEAFNDYDKTTFTAWKVTLEKIALYPTWGKHAAKLLNCMAYLVAESIESSLLSPLMPGAAEKERKQAIQLLVRYSMVTKINGESSQFQISPLVQQVIRLKVAAENIEEAILEELLQVLSAPLLELSQNLPRHMVIVYSFAKNYPELVRKYRDFPKQIVKVFRRLGVNVQDSFLEAGDAEAETEKMTVATDMTEQEALHSEFDICSALFYEGRYSDALDLLLPLLEKVRGLFGDSHVETLECENLLAEIYRFTREYEKALKLHLQVLEKRKEGLGENHPKAIESLLNVGHSYSDFKHYAKAMDCYNKAIEINENIFGKNSPQVVEVYIFVADLKGKTGETEKVENIYKELYQNKSTLTFQLKLKIAVRYASFLDSQRKFEKALEVCNEIVEEEGMGTKGREALIFEILHLKGKLLAKLGRRKEEENWCKVVYDHYLKSFGEENEYTLLAKWEVEAFSEKPKESLRGQATGSKRTKKDSENSESEMEVDAVVAEGSRSGIEEKTECDLVWDTVIATSPSKKITYDRRMIAGRSFYDSKMYVGKYNGQSSFLKVLHTDDIEKQLKKLIALIEYLVDNCRHENIVKYYGCEVMDDDKLAIAMQVCGTNVHEWIMEPENLEKTCQGILVEIADGMSYLHSKNIVHGNLKPPNILVKYDTVDTVTVKISDVGVIRTIPYVGRRFFGHISDFGTEAWMAPELAKGYTAKNENELPEVSMEADVFALGCIFYYIASKGSHPFGDPIQRMGNIEAGKWSDEVAEELEILGASSNQFITLTKEMTAHQKADRPKMDLVKTKICNIFNWSKETSSSNSISRGEEVTTRKNITELSCADALEGIEEHLSELAKITHCSAELYEGLIKSELLSQSEVDEIKIRKTQNDKSQMLYKLLRSKLASYITLVEVLSDANETGAVQLLESAVCNIGKTVDESTIPEDNSSSSREDPATTGSVLTKMTANVSLNPSTSERSSAGLETTIKEGVDFITSNEELDVVVERPSTRIKHDFMDAYCLPSHNKGLALILNIAQFKDNKTWPRRNGSDTDVHRLASLFTQLGYEIFPKSDTIRNQQMKTKQDILALIEDFKLECSKRKPSSIILFVGSHGRHPNKILASDGVTLDMHEDILERFNHDHCPELKGKPKVFLVQACQVSKGINEKDDCEEQELPISDAAIFSTQVPPSTAQEDKQKGSTFVECLTYMTMKHAKDKSFQEILELTGKTLDKVKSEKKTEEAVTSVSYNLKPLYFPVEP